MCILFPNAAVDEMFKGLRTGLLAPELPAGGTSVRKTCLKKTRKLPRWNADTASK
jgi:hypothetical protein